MMIILGLLLIAIAWAFEAYSVWKKHTKIGFEFLTLYVMGVLLLILDGIQTASYLPALLNLLSLLAACFILVKIKR